MRTVHRSGDVIKIPVVTDKVLIFNCIYIMFTAVHPGSVAEWSRALAIINYRYREVWSSNPSTAIIILKI